MGNIQTKKEKPRIDGGGFTPIGIYSAEQDFDGRAVRKFILDRRIAPFYKGLAEIDDSLKDQSTISFSKKTVSNAKSTRYKTKSKLDGYKLTPADLYQNAIECPICFLYYPKNINYTRCCHQPICTECFVQMKRQNATTSATCPYCVESNFGVVYEAPCDANFYTNGFKSTSISRDDSKTRRASVHYNSSEVITSDDIRPDHTHKPHISSLAHRRTTLNIARRLFRLRQNPRHTDSTQSNAELTSNDTVGLALEDLMIMEAIRQSLPQREIDERSIEVIHRDSNSEEHYTFADASNEQHSTHNQVESVETQSAPSQPDRPDRDNFRSQIGESLLVH
ncbi:SNF1-interacting protein [Basidiobolus ranarum]|uniref:SNF1-interacting protein n=1 Tax=Basidiobolus ranarum TaxID=34480 RepID=A0ABR2W4B7_9FUNG